MKLLVIVWGVGEAKISPEEQPFVGWVFGGTFVIAIAIAFWLYLSWKSKQSK
jgi:hypothetical protein